MDAYLNELPRIMIASPILHVPVPLGTAIFSLGELHLKTKQPCEYKCALANGLEYVLNIL